MTRNRTILVRAIALLLITVAATLSAKQPTVISRANRKAMDRWVNEQLDSMSRRERIAQLIMPMYLPDRDEGYASLDLLVGTYKVGGLLIGHGSVKQCVAMVNRAQSTADVPLLISMDAEWGIGMRCKEVPSFPHNMAIGAISNEKLIYEYGREVARQCRAMGVHVNFAPVLDVLTASQSKAIGNRAYGSTAQRVTACGIAFSKGMEDGGVLSVAKHFPGHGSTKDDSHAMLPLIDKSRAELEASDLKPFRSYINAGLGGVLVAHLNVPAFGRAGTPTTYIEAVVDGYLKRHLGFEGLIFTDALDMKGAATAGSPCVRAFKAGNDILLAPLNVKSEIDAMERAIFEGEITMDDLNARVRRVLQYKYALGLASTPHINPRQALATINDEPQASVLNALWADAITVVSNPGALLPVKNVGKDAVAIVDIAGNSATFTTTARKYGRIAELSDIDDIDDSKASTFIVPITDDSSASVAALSAAAQSNRPIVAVLFIDPYKAAAFARGLKADNVAMVMAYENTPTAQSYAAQTIFGGNAARGHLPVDIEGVAATGAGVTYEASRLGFATPEMVGVDSHVFAVVDSLVNEGLSTKAFPGCQVLMVRDGKVFLDRCYGVTDYQMRDAVTDATIYDLASVTKAIGTLPGVMKAYDNRLLSLDAPIGGYIPELTDTLKQRMTPRQLLFHESGMRPSLSLHEIMLDPASYTGQLYSKSKGGAYTVRDQGMWGNASARLRSDILDDHESYEFDIPIARGIYASAAALDTVRQRIYDSPVYRDKKYRYSCLNFCLLMDIEQRLTGTPHDRFMATNFFEPLGADHLTYNPLRAGFDRSDIAPTELDNMLRHQQLHGYTHDELACFSGGVQGNAGLFGNALDVAKMCQMWLNGGQYGGARLLSPATVKLFTTAKSATCRRGLGFDKPDVKPDDSPTCPQANLACFGHLGYTGTVFWVDPVNDMIFVFLTNRVNPTRVNPAFTKLDIRPKLFGAFYDNLLD